MKGKVVLARTNSAIGSVNVDDAFSIDSTMIPCSLWTFGSLIGSEEVVIHYSPDNGENWYPAQNDGPVVLTPTQNQYNVTGPVLVGFTKTSTTDSVGVVYVAKQKATNGVGDQSRKHG
jgi:hypothetical protein